MFICLLTCFSILIKIHCFIFYTHLISLLYLNVLNSSVETLTGHIIHANCPLNEIDIFKGLFDLGKCLMKLFLFLNEKESGYVQQGS